MNKGETLDGWVGVGLTYSGLGRVGPVSCQTSRIPGWEHWLNQPQEAALLGSLPSLSSALEDMTSDIYNFTYRKPVGRVIYTNFFNLAHRTEEPFSLQTRTVWNT